MGHTKIFSGDILVSEAKECSATCKSCDFTIFMTTVLAVAAYSISVPSYSLSNYLLFRPFSDFLNNVLQLVSKNISIGSFIAIFQAVYQETSFHRIVQGISKH